MLGIDPRCLEKLLTRLRDALRLLAGASVSLICPFQWFLELRKLWTPNSGSERKDRAAFWLLIWGLNEAKNQTLSLTK